MLLAEGYELLFVQRVSELESIVGQKCFEELKDGIWCLKFVLHETHEISWDHDCVALRLTKQLSLLIKLVAHFEFKLQKQFHKI